jgi:S1-C subfamily serine protease
VSASHCVSTFNPNQNRVEIPGVPLFISYDADGVKVYHPATVVMAGAQGKGDDFAILHVATDDEWPLLRIGDHSRIKQGELVINVAAPKGLGLQVFFGYVSMINMDRPIQSNGINWLGATLLQIPAGPGSSGSAVASEKQGAIVAFIVGGIRDNPSAVAIPASRFLQFRKSVEDGDYEWFSLPEEEE